MWVSIDQNETGEVIAVVKNSGDGGENKIIFSIEKFHYSAEDLTEAILTGFADFPAYDRYKNGGVAFSECCDRLAESGYQSLLYVDIGCKFFQICGEEASFPAFICECIPLLQKKFKLV